MNRKYCDRCKEYIDDVDNAGFGIRGGNRPLTILYKDHDLCENCFDACVRALKDAGLQVKN
jgi:hypothetical protein